MTIPDSMTAVQLDAYDQPLTVRQCPVLKPGPGEVLVRMAAAPINPSDMAFLQGSYGYQRSLPTNPGIEGSGTVVAAGSGFLPRLLMGQRVACSSAASGGTWAEYMVTSAKLCFPLGAGLTLEQGSMLLVNPLTALAIFEIARNDKHRAIVNSSAAGALGQMILRLGQQRGLPVINIVRRPAQADFLRSLGAQYVLDSNQPDFADQLQSLVQQLNATLLLDAVGGSLTKQLIHAAPFAGTVMVYGNLSKDSLTFDARQFIFDDKRVTGFYLANWLAKRNLLQILLLGQQAQGLLKNQLQTVVQQRLPFASVEQALNLYMNNMSAGKVLLTPQ